MSKPHVHAAHTEGFLSYKKNHGAYINPYAIGTVEINLFEWGWSQAVKRTLLILNNNKYNYSEENLYISNNIESQKLKIEKEEYSKKSNGE